MNDQTDLHRLHVLEVDATSVKTATMASTQWYLHLPRNENAVFVDEAIPGTVARVWVASWLMDRHGQIILGIWTE
jgi:hypothetical protein